MNLATCRLTLEFTPSDNPVLPLTSARQCYGTAKYLTGEPIEVDNVTATLCWTPDRVNVWTEMLSEEGNMRVLVLKGWAPIIRKLVTAEVEHFDTQVVFVEPDTPQPVRVTEDGTATFELPFGL